MAIRVLVVQGPDSSLEAVQRLLLQAGDIDVIDSTSSGREAMRLAIDLRPDVLITSTSLEQPSSFELIRFLKLRLPRLGVLLLADEENEDELYESVRVGVSAYLPGRATAEELLDAVRRAARGEYLIDDAVLTRAPVAARILREFREISSNSSELVPLMAPLSPREIEILDQVARGFSNKQIARNLSISDQTVKNHISSILRKLAVNDRTQAVVFALRHGWIRIDGARGS